ncbi:MAG: enoyl-CoA hydratase/isomerase family protein [Desulfobacteraceae bacterium]|nr:enoyl-CoA hydratase/isomerase family protein [Desulfobacteraceae bacterium]MBU4054277.1 enoyl-CoA hydratase/isomerase family protein [Pseudomonadota bacterium]
MTEKPNIIVHKQGGVCTVTIHNPEKRNALSPACLFDITETFHQLAEEDTVRVVILRGAGKDAFSAGADIVAMPTKNGNNPVPQNERKGDITSASLAIQKFPYPVIGMLYGYTLGAGCVLAMACDIRIASDKVKMGIPTSRMGLVSTYEGFKRFLTVLGYSTAMEIFLTGRQYNSRECLAMGLANHLVDDDELESYTLNLAEEITRCAPLSLRGSKYVLNRITENPIPSTGELTEFARLASQARQSDDHEEAKMAFKEKRKPVFKGK